MLVNVVFTYDYDLIDVPQELVKQIKKLQLKCDKWLYNKENEHEYWIKEGLSTKFAVNTCSEAFVYWLNTFVLADFEYKAKIVQKDMPMDSIDISLPTIYY